MGCGWVADSRVEAFVVRRSWPEGFGSFLEPVRVREGVG
jgi:hypothetical protein